MCGIAGYVHPEAAAWDLQPQLSRMLATLVHRGPDDEGGWTDPGAGVALGQRRLAIVELSQAGHQPMASACGSLVISFNGEVYNHAELRLRLEREGHRPAQGWRGHSDTETLIECMAAWGVRKALQEAVGMFGLAVWDRRDRSLTLARDRMGEKPLYYGWQGEAFLFASELKALRVHRQFQGLPDWDGANAALQLGYIPAPRTIWRGVHKLPPGHVLQLLPQHFRAREIPRSTPYWSLAEAARAGEMLPFEGSYPEAVEQLEALILRSVQLQSMADVPVGAFLSGGVDSSTVVAMMQKAVGAQVTTFSIGMPERGLDESEQAAAVARHLGTRHVAHEIRAAEALALIPCLASVWDEPFGDSSQLPTFLVSRLARERVTVALSGDGGDELFLGYPQYPLLQKVWRLRALGVLPWDTGLRALGSLGNGWIDARVRQARTVVGAWRQPDARALNEFWMRRFQHHAPPLRRGAHVSAPASFHRRSAAETAALADAAVYLPDDILVKVDRAAMANSLETRAPLLDHRVVEFALRLPLAYKLGQGTGKRILRDVLYRHVPRKLVDRPKMGFSIPLDRWLREELRDWTGDLLAEIPGGSELFDRSAVQAIWQDHAAGTGNRTEQLWPVLSLVGWCKANGVPL